MIKIENVVEPSGEQVEAVIRGMRNPMNSWGKSDSYWESGNMCDSEFVIGDDDIALMSKLKQAGTEHRKYLRMWTLICDVTAPLYWWKEIDQYRIGVTTNSCSTMHKIHERDLTEEDFSVEKMIDEIIMVDDAYWTSPQIEVRRTIAMFNYCRKKYVETKEKKYWDTMIQLLPSSYNQRRTICMTYETALNIIRQRKYHKLTEWREFVKFLEETFILSLLIEEPERNTEDDLK